jgi:hypothetical protein
MDRIASENGGAGLVGEHEGGAVNSHGSADLGEPSHNQPVEPIGFTIFIC